MIQCNYCLAMNVFKIINSTATAEQHKRLNDITRRYKNGSKSALKDYIILEKEILNAYDVK